MPTTVPSPRISGELITDAKWNELVDALTFILGLKASDTTLDQIANSAYLGHSIGDIKAAIRTSDESIAWLRCDGRTIGNSSSGADLADNNLQSLFEHLWAEFDATVLLIYDSAGAPSTKGASANDDWTANKRIALPDLRGRVLAGVDDPTGSDAANVVTDANADKVGGTYGSETHTLTTDELAAHSHRIVDVNASIGGGENPYSVDFQSFTSKNGNNLTFRQIVASNGPYSVNIIENTGGGQGHNNVQPTMFVNYFIYSGN
ncbi:MAG: hypothetical protein KatS3mg087_1773 [Patescibacteria group bacterium]|nr:MAG: hypothetical protein KatS3mg087_1773 [Patescibacteria group bacterium]